MTTIRKIVTSKIDGSDANSNDLNEIRPFGETAFYLDTNGPTNKLTLMMFDGVRTNQRSKVLSPGVLYGSNADSADGGGLDTIKLIPDARLHYNFGDYGNDQYLVIDPTAPNHIHIRAGGTIDSSNAELYLGGELTHVKVSDGADNVVIRTSTLGEGITERNWIFGSDGSLSLPNGLTVLGGAPLLVAETGNDLGIETSRLASVSAECAPRGAGDNFVADITDNDDITVVREGWNVVIDGTLYVVTTIMTGIGEFDIFATGANFVPGTAYTFINPTPVTSNWVFGLDGTLTTPGSGTISHRNNDLKVEVTGTDVIVLRTAGGDLILNADASLTFSDGVSKISALNPAQSGGISGISVAGKDRAYISIGDNSAFSYSWDFRAFGAGSGVSTVDPTIQFPGGGWLREDMSDLVTGGFDVPVQLGSQGAFTLTVTNNSTFPDPASIYNWTFGTDGTTTLPADSILKSEDSLLINVVDSNAATLESTYNNKVIELDAAFAVDSWTGAGYPAGPTSSQALNAAKAMNPLIPDAWITIASELTIAYNAWQTALDGKYWVFGLNGTLTVPLGGDILDSTGASVLGSSELVGDGYTIPAGSSLVIATAQGGGLTGWSSTALSVASNSEILSETYIAGSTITFQDGSTATITGIDNYPEYHDIFWDTPKTGDLFPITLKTSNFVAAAANTARISVTPGAGGTEQQWIFGSDGSLTFPDTTVQTSAAAPYGQYDHLIDGTNTPYAVPAVSMSLFNVHPASGYQGSDVHTIIIPIGQPGQRLVITNQSSLCALSIGGAVETPYNMAISSQAEFVYVAGDYGNGWRALYGTV